MTDPGPTGSLPTTSGTPETLDIGSDYLQRQRDASVKVAPFSPIQRIGMWLAFRVGLPIVTVTMISCVGWVVLIWQLPAPTLTGDAAADQAMLQNFRTLQEIRLEPPIKLFQVIVVTGFLPIFTAVVGYLFADRTNQKNDDDP